MLLQMSAGAAFARIQDTCPSPDEAQMMAACANT
jgi:hypothetical protein